MKPSKPPSTLSESQAWLAELILAGTPALGGALAAADARLAGASKSDAEARLGDAPELIGAALLLLSPAAGSFIVGEALYVDGGFTSMTI